VFTAASGVASDHHLLIEPENCDPTNGGGPCPSSVLVSGENDVVRALGEARKEQQDLRRRPRWGADLCSLQPLLQGAERRFRHGDVAPDQAPLLQNADKEGSRGAK
jgi:hypothetical protein